jgi:hypothetical protein
MNEHFSCVKCSHNGWVSYEPALGKPVMGHCSRCLEPNQEISVFAQSLAAKSEFKINNKDLIDLLNDFSWRN